MEKEKYYISTAIAYTSSKPHIGNTYEIVLADAIARNKRLEGYDVIWDLMDTTYDNFVRTTDKNHEKVVQHIFKKMYDKGDIYKGEYKGLYCTPCESFWTETQLVDGKCPDCGREVLSKSEEAYFFKLSKYQDKLIKYIESHPEFIQPESRKNEMVNNFLKPGLQDLCVSRTSFKWGIPVDFDDKHVVYVWLDALTNYITNIGYDVDNATEEFTKKWPADLHLIGKDIIRFHTLYWPCFLMSLELPLPKQIFGHPWLLSGGDKMSKSKGNVLYADDLVEKYGVDTIRYFVLHETPFADDGIITEDLIIERNHKYFDGVVSKTDISTEFDASLIDKLSHLGEKVKSKMDNLRIADAIDEIFSCLRASNKYIDETTPWILAKDEKEIDKLRTVLYNLIESIRICAVYLQPFLPQTALKIFKLINTGLTSYESTIDFGAYVSGTKVGEAEILFGRIEKESKES